MELLAPILLPVLVLFAPFIALQAYFLVWLLGPAIRRAGECWEQGRQRAISDRHHDLNNEYSRGLNDAWSGHVVPGVSVTPVLAPKVNTAPATPKRYTITGKEIR